MNTLLKKALPCVMAAAVSFASVPAAGALAALADNSTDVVLSAVKPGDMSSDCIKPGDQRSTYHAGDNSDAKGDGYITTKAGEDNAMFWGMYPALTGGTTYYMKTIIRVHNFGDSGDGKAPADPQKIGYMKDEKDGYAPDRFGDNAIGDNQNLWEPVVVAFTDTDTINQNGNKDHEITLHTMFSGTNETSDIYENLVISADSTPLALPDSYVADNVNYYVDPLTASDPDAITTAYTYYMSLTDAQRATYAASNADNANKLITLATANGDISSSSSQVSSSSSSSVSSGSSSSDVSSTDSSSSVTSDNSTGSDSTASDSSVASDSTASAVSATTSAETNADTGDTAVPAAVAAVLVLSAGAALLVSRKIRK